MGAPPQWLDEVRGEMRAGFAFLGAQHANANHLEMVNKL